MHIYHVGAHMLLVSKELATNPTLKVVTVAVFDVAVVAQRSKGVEHLVARYTHALLVHGAHMVRQLGISTECVSTHWTTETVHHVSEWLWGHGFS